MKKFLIASALLLMACASQQASAGPPSTLCNAGNSDCATITNSKLDVNATASIAGFRPTSTGTPISVTTGGVTGTLPAGTEVVATNVGTTNTAYCKLGASATTSDQAITPNGGWFGFFISGDTQLTCITSTSTTTVNMVGGSGLPTGTGGGGGSGGGAITAASGSYASGALASGSVASGALVDVLASQGTVAPGTAATKATLIAGKYNSTPPTLTDGQQASLQFDAAGNALIAGGYAQGSTTAGQNLSPVGGRTLSATPTDTTAKTNEPVLSLNGATVVAPYALADSLVQGTTAAMTGTTSTSLVASPGGSLRNYITNITCVNSHATVGTFVTVQDGSGGTALYTLAAAAVFGGSTITFPAPLRQPTAATALFVADVTTGANVICSASGFKAL